MLRKYVLPIVLALPDIPLLFWAGNRGDYPSLNISIYVIFFTGLSWIAAVTLLIRSILNRRAYSSFSLYITILLLEGVMAFYILSGPISVLLFFWTPFVVTTIVLIIVLLYVTFFK
jgi:hypothetical protein